MRYFIQSLFTAAIILTAPAAHAAQPCQNPAGDEGDQVYNITYHVMQYCNGTNWIAMGSHSASGDGLGDHIAGQALDMGGFRIQNLAPPTADNHAATRAYVTSAIAAIPAPTTPNLSAVLATGNAAGNRKITGLATPTVGTDAAHKTYVDGKFGTLTNNKWCRTNSTQVICDQDAPAGDGDSLAGLACSTGQIAVKTAGGWGCTDMPDGGGEIGCTTEVTSGFYQVIAPISAQITYTLYGGGGGGGARVAGDYSNGGGGGSSAILKNGSLIVAANGGAGSNSNGQAAQQKTGHITLAAGDTLTVYLGGGGGGARNRNYPGGGGAGYFGGGGGGEGGTGPAGGSGGGGGSAGASKKGGDGVSGKGGNQGAGGAGNTNSGGGGGYGGGGGGYGVAGGSNGNSGGGTEGGLGAKNGGRGGGGAEQSGGEGGYLSLAYTSGNCWMNP